MSHQADKLIQKARPKLSVVAPLTHKICLGFALVNVAIWALLSRTSNAVVTQVPVPIVNQVINYDVWAWWFMFLGVWMFVALMMNRWKSLKIALGVGLFSKFLWTYALLYLVFHGYPIYATCILWGFLAWTQAWTIIHFIPPLNGPTNDQQEGVR